MRAPHVIGLLGFLVGAGALVPLAPAAGLVAIAAIVLLLIVCGSRGFAALLLVAAPFLFYLGPASRLLLTAVIALGVFKLPELTVRRSQLTPLILFGGYTLLRLLMGGGPFLEAFGSPSRFLSALIFGLLGASIWSRQDDPGRLGLLALGLPLLILGSQVAGGLAWSSDIEGSRLTGGLSAYSDLGVFAAMAFAALLPFAREQRISGLLAGAAAMAVFASGTRIAMAAVVLSFLAFAGSPVLARKRIKAYRKSRVVLVGALAALVLPVVFPAALERVQQAISQGGSKYASRATDDSIGIRNVIWSIQTEYRSTLPFNKRLIGAGPGTAERLVAQHFRGGISLPHSEYQHLLTDYGYVGLGLYVAALALLALNSLRSFRRSGAALVGFLLSVTLAVLSATDNPLFYPHAMLLPFVLLAAATRQEERHAAEWTLVKVAS